MVPKEYKTAGTLMMVAGLFNIMMSLLIEFILCIYVSAFAIATLGFGCIGYFCMLWPLLQLIMGIIETITGYQAMNGQPVPNAKAVSIGGIVIGVMNFSMIPVIMEVFAMLQFQDDKVVAWLEGSNIDAIDSIDSI